MTPEPKRLLWPKLFWWNFNRMMKAPFRMFKELWK